MEEKDHEEEEEEDEEYYDAYNDVDVHEAMITDAPRMKAYAQAVLDNVERIRGRVVVDVGCGTSVLSLMCARAGARKVTASHSIMLLVNIYDLFTQLDEQLHLTSCVPFPIHTPGGGAPEGRCTPLRRAV